jgi:hypothetical protein
MPTSTAVMYDDVPLHRQVGGKVGSMLQSNTGAKHGGAASPFVASSLW